MALWLDVVFFPSWAALTGKVRGSHLANSSLRPLSPDEFRKSHQHLLWLFSSGVPSRWIHMWTFLPCKLYVFLIQHHSSSKNKVRNVTCSWLKHFPNTKLACMKEKNRKGRVSLNWFFLVEVQLPMLIVTALKIPINVMAFHEMSKKGCWLKRSLFIVMKGPLAFCVLHDCRCKPRHEFDKVLSQRAREVTGEEDKKH